MARIPMVTRTITATEVTVLCINIDTAEPFNRSITLSGTYKDEKAMLKAASSVIENETVEGLLYGNDRVKAVHIVESRETETLYGMTEQEFIQRAKVLPPRTKNEN